MDKCCNSNGVNRFAYLRLFSTSIARSVLMFWGIFDPKIIGNASFFEREAILAEKMWVSLSTVISLKSVWLI